MNSKIHNFNETISILALSIYFQHTTSHFCVKRLKVKLCAMIWHITSKFHSSSNQTPFTCPLSHKQPSFELCGCDHPLCYYIAVFATLHAGFLVRDNPALRLLLVGENKTVGEVKGAPDLALSKGAPGWFSLPILLPLLPVQVSSHNSKALPPPLLSCSSRFTFSF